MILDANTLGFFYYFLKNIFWIYNTKKICPVAFGFVSISVRAELHHFQTWELEI